MYACAVCNYRITGVVLGLPLAVYGLWRETFDNGRLIR